MVMEWTEHRLRHDRPGPQSPPLPLTRWGPWASGLTSLSPGFLSVMVTVVNC